MMYGSSRDREAPFRPAAIWVPSADFLAASCHIAWAALLVSFAAPYIGAWTSVAAMMAFALPKEFIIDPWIEQDTYYDGLIDALFYFLGSLVGLGFFALRG